MAVHSYQFFFLPEVTLPELEAGIAKALELVDLLVLVCLTFIMDWNMNSIKILKRNCNCTELELETLT
jgi:hypothetical protein